MSLLAPGGEGERRKTKGRCPSEKGFRVNFCRETRRFAAASLQGEIAAAPSVEARPRAQGQHHHHHHYHHHHYYY